MSIYNSSTYEIPSINDYKPKLTDAAFYGDIRFDADDTLPDYIGLHALNGADQATADGNWKIYKFTYVGGAATRIQLAYGSWTGRVALFP